MRLETTKLEQIPDDADILWGVASFVRK